MVITTTKGNKMNNVTQLLTANTEQRIALAQQLKNKDISFAKFEKHMASLANREASQIAKFLGN
jgi:hypothetical protein